MKSLNEMTVLITGASGGVGAAIAERFAVNGMNVILHYHRSLDAVNAVADRCRQLGANVITIAANLRNKHEIEQMKQTLLLKNLIPDILVNNAGVAHYGTLGDISEAEWDEVMDVNLKSMFLCTQQFMPTMISQKYGRIINVSSIWGNSGASCEVAYSTSKGGVNAFTKALAKELAPSRITVNAVAPGIVDTMMMDKFSVEEKLTLENEIPMGRFAFPEEIASLVHFLALPESSYITGQVISPNGGFQT